MSGKGKREEPSIRIRDESLASLGFRTLVSLGFSKTDANVKFQSFILSSQHRQCVNVLQAYLCCFSLQQGVINNAKRKWQIIDTNDDFNTRFS